MLNLAGQKSIKFLAIRRGEGSKIGHNCRRIVLKNYRHGGGGCQKSEKLPTSFMDGPYVDSRERTFNFGCYVNGLTIYRRSEFPWIKLAKR